jgi:dTDP-glucose pyrophosphorylase
MNIVIPMAGRGSRFADAGWTLPKPLIDVLGKPMYAWATDGLPLERADRLIFICLKEHLHDLQLERDIRSRYEQYAPVIIELNEVTSGQLCTVLKARDQIDCATPLLIFNADTYCPTTLTTAIDRWQGQADGILDVFEAEGDRWSFVRMDENGRVSETAEKRRISSWATTGLYYFQNGGEFARQADRMIAAEDRVNGEFYVAPLYNRMIATGMDIRANIVPEVWVLGTPEDLQYFSDHYSAGQKLK